MALDENIGVIDSPPQTGIDLDDVLKRYDGDDQ
jgi:hypothetical protein